MSIWFFQVPRARRYLAPREFQRVGIALDVSLNLLPSRKPCMQANQRVLDAFLRPESVEDHYHSVKQQRGKPIRLYPDLAHKHLGWWRWSAVMPERSEAQVQPKRTVKRVTASEDCRQSRLQKFHQIFTRQEQGGRRSSKASSVSPVATPRESWLRCAVKEKSRCLRGPQNNETQADGNRNKGSELSEYKGSDGEDCTRAIVDNGDAKDDEGCEGEYESESEGEGEGEGGGDAKFKYELKGVNLRCSSLVELPTFYRVLGVVREK
ncbi:hypothetical protein B0H19DRAFT_1081500 [Mycena capillaripes]|nr:hypothetical protein B0H19DRAFT_1081500 [Mycena capillaripes]